MMMDKRQRVLMKQRHFIKRLKRVLSRIDVVATKERIRRVTNTNWRDFMNSRDFNCYRTTSTPCSCYMCSGYNKYKREKFKKDTFVLLKEELEY